MIDDQGYLVFCIYRIKKFKSQYGPKLRIELYGNTTCTKLIKNMTTDDWREVLESEHLNESMRRLVPKEIRFMEL